jgi:hypothetical protein
MRTLLIALLLAATATAQAPNIIEEDLGTVFPLTNFSMTGYMNAPFGEHDAPICPVFAKNGKVEVHLPAQYPPYFGIPELTACVHYVSAWPIPDAGQRGMEFKKDAQGKVVGIRDPNPVAWALPRTHTLWGFWGGQMPIFRNVFDATNMETVLLINIKRWKQIVPYPPQLVGNSFAIQCFVIFTDASGTKRGFTTLPATVRL